MSRDDRHLYGVNDDDANTVNGVETAEATEHGHSDLVKPECTGVDVVPPTTQTTMVVLDDLPAVLTVEEVAHLLRVHPKTVRKMHRRHQLPGGRKLGPKIIRFDRDSVVSWLRGNASVSRRRA